MMTNQNLKRYKITFTTYQEFPPSPILTWGDIEDFWHGVWEVSNFGQAYCVDVGDVDYDTATVTHSIWKFLDSDPRKIDRNEVSKLIEDEIIWYANAMSSPDELVELSAINSIHPENIFLYWELRSNYQVYRPQYGTDAKCLKKMESVVRWDSE